MVQHWRLPPEFAVSTYCNRLGTVPDEAWLPLVHTVTLASALANTAGFGIVPKPLSLVGHPSAKYLGLSDIKLAALRVDVESKLEIAISILSS